MSDWIYVSIGAALLLWVGGLLVFAGLGWALKRWRGGEQAA